jgi:tetratricopeptide (TPR) repeat protein
MPARLARFAPYLAAAGAALLLYLPTLQYGFVYDDLPLIVNNPALAPGAPWLPLVTRDIDALWRGASEVQSNYYRPVTLLALAGLRRVLGLEPRAWHALAVLAHVLASVLAVLLLRRFGQARRAAALGGVLFACHPAHVSAVAWVSGLQDLLLALSATGATLVYLAACRRPSLARSLGAALVYLIALGVKEAAVGLLLFAFGHALLGRVLPAVSREGPAAPRARLLAALTVATALYLAVRVAVLGTLARPFPGAPGVLEALASVPVALAAYARLLLWPVDLGLLHPARPVAQAWSLPALLTLAAMVLLFVGACLVLRRRGAWALPSLWLLAWLAPCLNLWAVNPEWIVMDRYLYLPLLALPWVLVGHAPEGPGRARGAALVALAGVWAWLSIAPREAFRDERAFWARQVQVDPGSSVAWTEQARLLADAGQLEAARGALERAQTLDPRALLPPLRLALLDLRTGAADAAARRLAELTRRSPGYVPAWRNLPVALARAGRAAEAFEAAQAAAQRHPGDVDVLLNLAILLRQQGDAAGALRALGQARARAPHDGRLLLREALLLVEAGRPELARQQLAASDSVQAAQDVRAQLNALRAALGQAPPPRAAPVP